MTTMETYNEKAFLLPGSISSCALYHAKVFDDGRYVFRIHDCYRGIELKGSLETEEGCRDALDKVTELISGLEGFKNFVFEIYFKNLVRHEESNFKEHRSAEF